MNLEQLRGFVEVARLGHFTRASESLHLAQPSLSRQISTLEKELRGSKATKSEEAATVGKLVAERAKAAGVERVVFDRAGFRYHGRIKSLADAAREAGLEF